MLAPMRHPAPERASTVLPEVKCSTCGRPVPLNLLGEHVCGPASPATQAPPPLPPATPGSPKSMPRFAGPAAAPNAGRAPSPLRRDVSSPGARQQPLPSPRPSFESRDGRPNFDGPGLDGPPRPSFDGPPRRPSFDSPQSGRPSMDDMQQQQQQRPRPPFDGPAPPPGSPRFFPPPPRDHSQSPRIRGPNGGPPPGMSNGGPPPFRPQDMGGPPSRDFNGPPPPRDMRGGQDGPYRDPPPGTGAGPFRGPEMMPLPPSPKTTHFPVPVSPRPSRAQTLTPKSLLPPSPSRSPAASTSNGPSPLDPPPQDPIPRSYSSSPMPDTTSGGSAGMAGVGRRAYMAELMLPGPPPGALGMSPGRMSSPGLQQMGSGMGMGMGDRRGNAPLPRLNDPANLRAPPPPGSAPYPSSPGFPQTPRDRSPPTMMMMNNNNNNKGPAERQMLNHAPMPSDATDDVRLPWARTPELESPPIAGARPVQPLRPRARSNASKSSDGSLGRPESSISPRRRQLTLDSQEGSFAALMQRNDSVSTAGGNPYARRRDDNDDDGDDDDTELGHGHGAPGSSSGHSDDGPPPPSDGTLEVLALNLRKAKSTSAMSGSTYSAYSRATSMQSPQLKPLAIESVLNGFDEGKNAKLFGKLTPTPPVPLLPPPPPSEKPSASSSASSGDEKHGGGGGGDIGDKHEKRTPPLRSRTAPIPATAPSSAKTSRSATTGRRKKDVGPCLVCGKAIEGRSVKGMCESCWKEAHLPKCHRCAKLIEGRAISSSDGQLEGKYHPACFTCSYETCGLPLTGPESDGSFYVFEGKPYCEYHYHSANRSLCKGCGKPIEGPCTQVHDGARFHRACLVCAAPGCGGELGAEYWEIQGSMLCERHARSMMDSGGFAGGVGGGGGLGSSLRPGGAMGRDLNAMRRQTRLFDMGAGGIMGDGGSGAGGAELGSIGEEEEEQHDNMGMRSAARESIADNDAAREAYLRSGPGVRRTRTITDFELGRTPTQATFGFGPGGPDTPTQQSFAGPPSPLSPDLLTPTTGRDPFARPFPPPGRSQTMGPPSPNGGGNFMNNGPQRPPPGFGGPPSPTSMNGQRPPPLGFGPGPGNPPSGPGFDRPGPPGGFGGPQGPPSPGMRGPQGGYFGPPPPQQQQQRGPGFNGSPGPGPGGAFNQPPPSGYGGGPPSNNSSPSNPNFPRGQLPPPNANGFGPGPGPGPGNQNRGPPPGFNGYGGPPPSGNFNGPPPGSFNGPPPGNFNGPPPGNFNGPPPGNFNGPPPGNFNGPPQPGYNGPPSGFNGPPPRQGNFGPGFNGPPPAGFNGPPQPGFAGPPRTGSPGPGNMNFQLRGPPPPARK